MADTTYTILVVDDDELMRKSVVDTLGQAGFKVLEAKDGHLGLELALKEHPTLVLTDHLMPDMTGVQMISKLREDAWGKRVPVILMTNMYTADTLNQTLEAGVTDYVMKSDLSLDKIVELVRARLQAAGL